MFFNSSQWFFEQSMMLQQEPFIKNSMENYESKVCTACRADAPKATQSQIEGFLNDYPSWELQEMEDVPQLMRSYSFKNYLQAVDFTNRIAELAEKEGHHPAILLEWGKVQVSWWTHKIRGLHENDFIMSAKTDQLFDSM